jgi:2-hydroxy-3-oxopropionate reductase
MGMPMAKSLVRGGFSLTVYDLNKAAIEEMKALGAIGAGSSREVAEASDVIISIVWDIPQTESVIFGDDGVWKGIKKGKTIIISSTIGPEYCRKLYAKAKKQGINVIDCCVTGRDPENGNRPATLIIGGDDDIVKQCWPVFESLGKNIFHFGGIGMGQSYKLVHNMIAKHMGAASRDCLIEGLDMGLKAGLDLKNMVDVLSVGAAARSMQNMGIKSGLDVPRIFQTLRGPAGITEAAGHDVTELDYALEMADSVGAKMALCRFIDQLDMPSVYANFYAAMKQYKSPPPPVK